ncbi:Uncharacterized protein APZ42_025471 [Daphnia magna]|uniref:Uncharacterized protein n=1 Tax=Daphnia magna TaxID=35525 RepID=A0A164T1C5_9CRUS|nr:Uncharacterized protein APZ42_025471 [Daphnia magna]
MSVTNYASALRSDAKTCYLDKLRLINCECPYSIPNTMWKNGLDCCPIVPKFPPPQTYSSIWWH